MIGDEEIKQSNALKVKDMVALGNMKLSRYSQLLRPLWTFERADREFSLFIRKRDMHCQRPLCLSRHLGPKELDCSHFIGRSNYATRYDPENCIALCRFCHGLWETEKDGAYREYMRRRLGYQKLGALERRSKKAVKRRDAIFQFQRNISVIKNDG